MARYRVYRVALLAEDHTTVLEESGFEDRATAIANASRPTCTCPMGHDIAWCSHRNAVYAFLIHHPEKYR